MFIGCSDEGQSLFTKLTNLHCRYAECVGTITNNAPKRNQSDTEANTVLSSGPNKKQKETKWATGSSKQIRNHQRTLIKKTKNLI